MEELFTTNEENKDDGIENIEEQQNGSKTI